MTREEAKSFLTDISYKLGNMAVEYLTEKDGEKMREAIKALEQGSKTDVLDKIMAEIEEQVLESLSDGGDDWFTAEKVNECLDIIDKYKAESEDNG